MITTRARGVGIWSTKDGVGALLITALGLFCIFGGVHYRVGTLSRMGAGYFPFTLGLLLVATGAALAVGARHSLAAVAEPTERASPRAWVCIIGGVVAFGVIARFSGLVPGTLVSVLIYALSDRRNSIRDASALAVAMTLIAVCVFHWALQMQFPLLSWG